MNAASLESSPRLQRVLQYLTECGAEGATTRDVIVGAGVCAVSSCVAELRANGIGVECHFEGRTDSGGHIHRYTLSSVVKEASR